MSEVNGFRTVSLFAQVVDRALQVNGVPQNDCGDEQVQAAGAMALVFIGPVADLAETIEEYGTAKRILLLAFVESYVTAPAKVGVLEPIEGKKCTFQLAEFTECVCEAVLAGIGRQLAQDHRGGDCSCFDRHGKAEQFEPMIADSTEVDGAGYERGEFGRHRHARQNIEPLLL
jgi:hypothetical protein